MTIPKILARARALWPDREAVVDRATRLTYRELGERVERLARALVQLGLGRGGVAAILAPNVHEFLEVYLACGHAGIVLCPLNHRLAPQEIASILERSGATVLLADSGFSDLVGEALRARTPVRSLVRIGAGALPSESDCYDALLAGSPAAMPEPEDLAADDLAHLYYTSGTTGDPKGVMLTHGNVTSHALSAIAELGLTDADTWLHAAPLFHLADAWATFAVTWVGGRHVCLPAFEPASALSLLAETGVTVTNLVPTMLGLMVAHPDAATRPYPALRAILSGGAPIAPETVRRVVATFGCEYVQTYGMTETSPFLTMSILKEHQRRLPREEQLRARSRTGRPFLGVELKVVREDWTEVEANDLEVGEIVVRGPTVSPGYYRDAEATAEAFRDGWLKTGDLAVVDREGSVNIVDRKKDTIITGGENVRSVEVEHVLYSHPAVLECAVIGVPDETWGEAVKAVVACRPGHAVTERELVELARSRLAHFKAPRSVDFVDALPKTGSGKISKRALREVHWAGRDRKVS